MSVVLFFNDHWVDGHGGELVIVDPVTKQNVIVEPKAGTLVLFKSDCVEHEVLPTQAQRLSFAGWYRTR